MAESILWEQREREIFTLDQGGAQRRYDPATLLRRYQVAAHDAGGINVVVDAWEALAEDGRLLNEGKDNPNNEGARKAFLVMLEVAQKTYNVKHFDDDDKAGWSSSELIQAVGQFFSYMGKKKEMLKTLPSSSQPAGEALAENLPMMST